MTRKVFVSGASGALGGRIAGHLLDADVAVVAGARRLERIEPLRVRGAEARRFDYDDPTLMRIAFEGCDTVVLVPTFAAVVDRVRQHYDALTAAREASVRKVVFASFLPATPESHFTVSPFMLFAEATVRQSGMAWTILRDGLYLDPLADWVPEIVSMGRIPYPAGEGWVAYVTRDDLAEAIAQAALSDAANGRLYRLTGPKAQGFLEIAGIISDVTGKPVIYDPMSEEDFARLCEEPEAPDYLPTALASLYRAVAAGEFDLVTDDIETLTGRAPEGVESYLKRKYG